MTMLTIIVIVVISSLKISPIENTIWTSLNNRGVEPRFPSIKDNHQRTEPVMTSSSQLINDYSLIVDPKGKSKSPKVVYNDPSDLLIIGSSTTNRLIRDDADIGFDHEDDDIGGPSSDLISNLNYPKSANLIAGNINDDVSKDAVGNKIKNIDPDPVTVIPSPPTVSPLWLDNDRNDNSNYNNQRDNNIANYSNEAIKFDDATPSPPVPIASATTRAPRRIIRARKPQSQQSKGKSPIPSTGNKSSSSPSSLPSPPPADREIIKVNGIIRTKNVGNNLNRYNSFANNEDKSSSGENNNSFESNEGSSSIAGGNGPNLPLKPVIKPYTDRVNLNPFDDFNPYGQPGIDFPAFSSPPLTNFRCSSQRYPGYYADPEAYCQAFYICQPDGREDAFLCPNGTLFNQKYFICDWYYNVDCSSSRNYYSLNSLLYIQPGVNNAANDQRKKSARLSAPSRANHLKSSSIDYIERDNDANYAHHDNYNKVREEFDSSYEIKPRTDNGLDSGENESEFVYPLRTNEPNEDSVRKSSNYVDSNQANQQQQPQQESTPMSKSESNNSLRGQKINYESKSFPNERKVATEFNLTPKLKTKSRKQTNWWIAEDLTNNLGIANNKPSRGKQSKQPVTTKNGSVKI